MIRVTVEKLPQDGSKRTIATAIIASDNRAGEDPILETYRYNLTTLPWKQRGGIDHPFSTTKGRIAFMRSQSVWKLIADVVDEANRKGEL